MLHGLSFGEEAGARNLVFFCVKWLQPAMTGTSFVRRVRFGSFRVQSVPPLCSATSGCSCVRSSMRFLESVVADRIGIAAVSEAVAIAICQQIFSILALVMFLLEILLKSASKSSFSCFGVEIRLWSCNFRRRCAYFYCFATQSLQIAL